MVLQNDTTFDDDPWSFIVISKSLKKEENFLQNAYFSPSIVSRTLNIGFNLIMAAVYIKLYSGNLLRQ